MSEICIVGPTAPYRGGIAHYTTSLAVELAKRHRVSVFNFSRMYPERLFPGKTQLDLSQRSIGVPSERTLDSLLPHTWWRTGRRIAALRPDRVVFQWWHPFFAPSYRGVSAAVRRYAPTTRRVFLCHNVLPHESSIVDRRLARLAYGGADAFVVQSRSEREVLRQLVTDAATAVSPHPVYDVFVGESVSSEQARERLGLSGDVLLFFGYVREYKGLRLAIEALPRILAERPVTLVVAGEFYEDDAPYRALVRRLGVDAHVRFFDHYIPNEDVPLYFAAADLVVQPYLHATQSGISQVAFAFERPVLATAVGGLPDVIVDGETGFLVPPRDPAAIAATVLRFFREQLGPSMRSRIAELPSVSWESLATAVTTV